jgi:hypothetical protein
VNHGKLLEAWVKAHKLASVLIAAGIVIVLSLVLTDAAGQVAAVR